jgi:tripartite-type tricarboxylate transporter receptor subunit TctC
MRETCILALALPRRCFRGVVARENTMMTRRPVLLALLALGYAALAMALWQRPAVAQDVYPSKPIKLVVPLAAGGGIDFTARVMAQKLSEVLGQQVVVENQGGAGGTIGVSAVVRAAPDGYTLLYHSVTGVVSSVVGKDLPYDWLRDLAAVSLVTRFSPVLIINPSLPARDLKEFIAFAKSNPGKLSYGSSGAGTAIHLASELFKSAAGVDIVHVPYRGNAGVMPDLLAGRIAMLIDGVPPQIKNIETGAVRALGVTTRTRAPALPNVPTLIEQGVDYEVPYWTAVYAPAATPKPIIDKLSAAIAKAMKDPGLVERLKKVGTEAVGSTPQEMDAFNRAQYELYRKVVQDPKLKLGLQ